MAIDTDKYQEITREIAPQKVTLVAVSKTKPGEDILALFELGQKDFGENYVQELVNKHASLPTGIRWHFIGHLQGNKVKYIAPFVHLIHGVDSIKLLREIDKQGAKYGRVINCLLQVHIAREDTKFGMDEKELNNACEVVLTLPNICVQGLMGMASFSADKDAIRNEFRQLKKIYDSIHARQSASAWSVLSMGMSADYRVAMEEGSSMIRIGSLLFGNRQ